MLIVYGDSTPFPYGYEYLEVVRATVDCCVELMLAQRETTSALDELHQTQRERERNRERIEGMHASLKIMMSAFRSSPSPPIVRTADAMMATLGQLIAAESQKLRAEADDDLATTRGRLVDARERTRGAIHKLLLENELPGSELVVRLRATESGTDGSVSIDSGVGLTAELALLIPETHLWRRTPSVGQIVAGIEVLGPDVPGEPLGSKPQPQRLDRHLITNVELTSDHIALTLRRTLRASAQFELSLSSKDKKVTLTRTLTTSGGTEIRGVRYLDAPSATPLVELCAAAAAAARELHQSRGALRTARHNDVMLSDFDEPSEIAARLLALIGPRVREIAARSGAPGELVLRRCEGEGRRDEVYLSKAGLIDKIMRVPASLRAPFRALGLDSAGESESEAAASDSIPIHVEAVATQPELG